MPKNCIEWKPLHEKALILIYQGKNYTQVCEGLGISRPALRRLVTSQLFKDKLADMQSGLLATTEDAEANKLVGLKKVRKLLEDNMIQAIRKMLDLAFNAKSEKIRYDALKDVLDRSGTKAPDHNILETRDRVYTEEELKSMKLVTSEIEQIAMRMSNQSSRFILDKRPVAKLSSDTDKGSEVKPDEEDANKPVSEEPITGNDTTV